MRTNQIDRDDLADLNERHFPNFHPEDYYLTLTSRNNIADQINEKGLNNLEAKLYEYDAIIKGEFDARLYPAEARMKLKVGAQVMFVRNDFEKGFVNGTIGKVSYLDNENIRVVISEKSGEERLIEVAHSKWEIKKIHCQT